MSAEPMGPAGDRADLFDERPVLKHIRDFARARRVSPWSTLGADLTSQQVCRLLQHMDRCGYSQCTPRSQESVTDVPFADLSSGYILRAIEQFPRQGPNDPWRRVQNYVSDRRSVLRAPIEDPALEFSRAAPNATTQIAA